MKTAAKNIFGVFKSALKEWWAKDPFKESAVIAYYAIFSLPGILVVVVTIAGYFFGRDAVSAKIINQITATMGSDTGDEIRNMISTASALKNSIWATVIGVITIVVGATGVFAQFQKSINNIWEVKADANKSGIWSLIKVRLFSFGLILAVAFLLIVSLVITTILSAFGDWISNHFSESFLVILEIVNFCVSLCILASLFALMFKFFPDAKIKWKHVSIGSFITAILFEIGKFALGLYFGKAEPDSGYGTAGSIVLILLWVSYSSMIVFYGAEFTHAYALLIDGEVKPDENSKVDHNKISS